MRWLTLTASTASSSALEKPVKDLPRNMDFLLASTAPTKALYHDQPGHCYSRVVLRWSMADGRYDLASLPELRSGVEYDVTVLDASNLPLMPI